MALDEEPNAVHKDVSQKPSPKAIPTGIAFQMPSIPVRNTTP